MHARTQMQRLDKNVRRPSHASAPTSNPVSWPVRGEQTYATQLDACLIHVKMQHSVKLHHGLRNCSVYVVCLSYSMLKLFRRVNAADTIALH
jgi:hypothetical protein